MNRLLQQIGFKTNRYDRPNRKWICGHEAEGCQSCPLGPDQKGGCRATTECEPVKKGDRYLCNRSPMRGDKCETGPLPDGSCCKTISSCEPRRTVRAQRGVWIGLATLFTLGFVIYSLTSPYREQVISPGPLTSQHATAAQSCSDCHTVSDEGVNSELIFDFHERAIADGLKCLECHQVADHELDNFSPHGLSPEKLDALSDKAETLMATIPPLSNALAEVVHFDGIGLESEVACQVCHKEHKGLKAELTMMSNQQCQACHTNQFQSFATEHPEFSNYPYKRRSRIIFDHASHYDTHFTSAEYAAEAPQSCQTCHETDDYGEHMVVKGFEASCATCHSDQIQGQGRAGAKGFAIFRFPSMDVRTLTEKGSGVGEWPEYAEGEATPFMEMLLQSDPEASEAMRILEGKELYDLSDASEAELKAAETLAWAIKGVLYDMILTRQDMVAGRFAEDVHFPRESKIHLTGRMNQDTLLAAKSSWVPQLIEEVTLYRAGQWKPAPPVAPAPVIPPKESPKAKQNDAGGSLLDEDDDEGGLLLLDEDGDEGGLLLAGDEDEGGLLMDDDADSEGDALLVDDDDEDEGGLLLADDEDDSGGLLMDDEADSDGDALLADLDDDGTDALLVDDEDDEGGLLEVAADEPAAPTPPKMPKVPSAEDWTHVGGWYRDDLTYTLYYRPSGHADAFLKAWIELSAKNPESESATDIFKQFAADKAPGLCMKCHSVDEDSQSKQLLVNWVGTRPMPHNRPFTRFKHSAHFSLLNESGCVTCHKMDSKSDYAASFIDNHDPHHFSSSFQPLDRMTCADCHTPDLAGDSCLQCHNYHTGTFRPALTEETPGLK